MQRSIQNPLVKDLTSEDRAAAQTVAEGLARAGHRAWLVGGCVRDLALGRVPKDVDLASAALPEEIEALFPRTIAVGKAFGTILVVTEHGQVELTSFRAEGDYSDGRRPDQVLYVSQLEEDAKRRDFTCNALYLDPLNDELRDPEGGLSHLKRGQLVCVGKPGKRFDEDGLRLLRLARFAAALELEVEPATLAGARAFAERIQGVSAERILGELERIAGLPAAACAIQLLQEIGVLARILPCTERDLEALKQLPPSPGPVLLLGTLMGELALADRPQALRSLEGLKPSRALARSLEGAWKLWAALGASLEAEGRPSQRVRRYRNPGWEAASALWRAFHGGQGGPQAERLDRWCSERAELGAAGLEPKLWLNSADLKQRGVPPGPRWGELLSQAEDLQLDGEFSDRGAALDWLAKQA